MDSRFVNPDLEINGEPKEFRNGEYGPQVCTDFILDFIKENKEKPFLVYYPMILTHCPFDPTPDSDDWDPERPGSKTYKGDKQTPQKHFKDMVAYMDKIVGQIDQALKDAGVRENTILIFTGDNGTDKPIKTKWNGITVAGNKGGMNDAGTRVPLIVSWPGTATPGVVSDELVDFADILPTICDATTAPLPEDDPGDGVSFLPTLLGKERKPKDYVYVWYNRRVFARTKTLKVLAPSNLSKTTFLDVSQPFRATPLDPDSLSEAQQAEATTLTALLHRLRATGPRKTKD